MESSSSGLNYYQKLSKALAEKQNVKVNLRTISNGVVIPRKKIKIVTKDEIISKSLFAKYAYATNKNKIEKSSDKDKSKQVKMVRFSQPEKTNFLELENVAKVRFSQPEKINFSQPKEQKIPKNHQQHEFEFKEPPEVKQIKRKHDNFLDLPNNFFNSFRGPDVTFFKKQKTSSELSKSDKLSDKPVTVNETMRSMTSSSSFKPPFASTPLDKDLGMVTDPEEMFSVINDAKNDEKEAEENAEQIFYQKFMEEVGSIAKLIDEKKFDHMEDPIKTERAHVYQILNVSKLSSQESYKQVLDESIQSNGFWKDHNKTIPSTPIIDPEPVKPKMQESLETPNVVLGQDSRIIFSEPHNDTGILFNSSNEFPATPDFLNESEPFNFDLSFGQSPLFPDSNEDPLNFLTPINTKKPKFAVQQRNFVQESPGSDSIFEENFVEGEFGELSLNEDQLNIGEQEQDKLDYTFSEFQSPPEVMLERRSQQTQQSKKNQLDVTFEQHSIANTSLSSYKWAPHITREFSTYNPNATISEFESPENIFEMRNIFKNNFN